MQNTQGIQQFEQALFSNHRERLYSGAEALVLNSKEQLTQEWQIRCKDMLLPQALQDFTRNKLRVAYLLSFIDSRTLDEQTRIAIGLDAHPHTPDRYTIQNQPSLLDWDTY